MIVVSEESIKFIFHAPISLFEPMMAILIYSEDQFFPHFNQFENAEKFLRQYQIIFLN